MKEEIRFINIADVGKDLQEKVRQWRNAEDIRRYMLTQHIITLEEHNTWIAGLKDSKTSKSWVVNVKDIPVGLVNLKNIDYKTLTAEWGYYIGEETYRGKGWGKRILFQLLEHVFEGMKFKGLVTKVLSFNKVALHIYCDTFKFREVGREPFSNEGEAILLEFSQKDWSMFKKRLQEKFTHA